MDEELKEGKVFYYNPRRWIPKDARSEPSLSGDGVQSISRLYCQDVTVRLNSTSLLLGFGEI